MLAGLAAALVVGGWVLASRPSVMLTEVRLPPPSEGAGEMPTPEALAGDVLSQTVRGLDPGEVHERLGVRWDAERWIATVRAHGYVDEQARTASAWLADQLVARWDASLALAREQQARVRVSRGRLRAALERASGGDRPAAAGEGAFARALATHLALDDRARRFGRPVADRPRVVRPARPAPGHETEDALAWGAVAFLVAAAAAAGLPRARTRRGPRRPSAA